MIERWGIPYIWTLPVAGIICLIVGFLFGIPALRLEGLYLALATFSLAIAVPQLLKHFEHWTGGVQGIVIAEPEAPFGLPLNKDQWLYYLSFGILFLFFLVGWNLLRGRVGRAIVAIRDHHIAAESMGAIVVQFVAPDSFNIFLSISFLTGIVIGGLASISGAIFGAFFIQFVPNYTQNISDAAPWAIYGMFLIVFMYAMPTGIAGSLSKLWNWLRQKRAIT